LENQLKERVVRLKKTTDNAAVWRNGGSSPQKVLCEFGSLPPARSSVEAATTPSRWDVGCKAGGSAAVKKRENRA
jgi:hypothetical protein